MRKFMMVTHSIIRGLVVKLYHRNRLICCLMVLLVADDVDHFAREAEPNDN